MSNGKPIPVWFSDEDRRRLEEACALAGYQHLSKYIRDKTLGRGDYRATGYSNMEDWAERQEIHDRLAGIERHQKTVEAMLAVLLHLVQHKATTGDISELKVAAEYAATPADLIPELTGLLNRFTQDI